MSDNKRTPLYDFHAANGARFVPFGGWEMPVQYTSILDEHKAVREVAGLFDVSHMGEVFVGGENALEFLDQLVTNDLSSLRSGQAIYSPMCYEDGGVVDDVIIYRFEPDRFFICLNASNTEKDVAWLKQQASRFNGVVVDNISDEYGQLAVQGPKAKDIVQKLSEEDLLAIKRFRFVDAQVAGVQCIVSRTGYTGEDGFELYCPADETEKLATAILEVGKDEGLKLCGLGSRDSLRLEAGYPLYGHEISQEISPIEGGLGWTVKLGKSSSFIGQAVLAEQVKDSNGRRLLHFVLDDRRIARQGTPVYADGNEVGVVASGTLSPVLGKPIGSALVDAGSHEKPLYVDLRGNKIPLVVKKAPLYK